MKGRGGEFWDGGTENSFGAGGGYSGGRDTNTQGWDNSIDTVVDREMGDDLMRSLL